MPLDDLTKEWKAPDRDELLRHAERAWAQSSPGFGSLRVGTAARFSNSQVIGGANIENPLDTPLGVCAEQLLLIGANSSIGPLSKDNGRDGLPVWEDMAIWANVEEPIMPCGLCRDVLMSSGRPDSEIISRAASGRTLEMPISWLLPLAGLGEEGDVSLEIDYFRTLGGYISSFVPDDLVKLLDKAKKASESSEISHSEDHRTAATGAALIMSDDTVILGWLTQEASSRSDSSAIGMAAREALQGPAAIGAKAKAVALFSDSNALRAPSGSDLQALHELCDGDMPIAFACRDGRKFLSSLAELLPNSFGKKGLAD